LSFDFKKAPGQHPGAFYIKTFQAGALILPWLRLFRREEKIVPLQIVDSDCFYPSKRVIVDESVVIVFGMISIIKEWMV